MNKEFWQDRRIVICGGASFIGSHVVETLRSLGVSYANMWVVDDFSSGKPQNLPMEIAGIEGDLRDYEFAKQQMYDADIVLDLSSVHGGRGFVGTNHDVAISDNLIINTNVLKAAVENGVERYAFSSSGCIYDTTFQMHEEESDIRVKEKWVDDSEWGIHHADGMYGLTKAVHEKTMAAYHRDGLIKTALCRFFTVFGPRMKENHFILATIAKTFIKTDPFYIWGSPDIVRNFTPVQNTVQGFLLATEKANGEAYNIGLEQRITINYAAEKIWELMGWKPKEIIYQPDKPVGIRNRVSDCTKARTELGWSPDVTFEQGLRETIDWYVSTHDVETVRAGLENKLTER